MTYQQTLKYLYGLQSRGMKFGLRNIRALVRSVGNPHRQFPSIHVAGTNGKGSTAAFLASIFTEARYKTALYTSPHLVRFTERIRINGVEMPEERLVNYARQLRPMIEKLNATFFEATTCIAFQYFADEKVDIAIIEAGLGGRLDSTNVITPLVSIITNIGIDHQEYLGNTLSKIAREKGGIIKRGVPCVTASRNADARRTLRSIARRKHARLLDATKALDLVRTRHIGLPGEHQVLNAATAAAAIKVMLEEPENRRRFSHVSDLAVKNGLRDVRRNTGIRARCEQIGVRFILDVAHNPDGMRALAGSLAPALREGLIVVFGVMNDKDYRTMIELAGQMGRCIVAVAPRMKRALPAKEIFRIGRELGCSVHYGGTVRRGIRIAQAIAGRSAKILVTGSNYVVGEALAILESTPFVLPTKSRGDSGLKNNIPIKNPTELLFP